jgi:hypothetical protein
MDEAAACDRLIVMADGRVVAEGKVADIVGFARVTVVETPDWAGAFEAISVRERWLPWSAAPCAFPAPRPSSCWSCSPRLELLAPMRAKVYSMPATLEERFLELTEPAARAGRGH